MLNEVVSFYTAAGPRQLSDQPFVVLLYDQKFPQDNQRFCVQHWNRQAEKKKSMQSKLIVYDFQILLIF